MNVVILQERKHSSCSWYKEKVQILLSEHEIIT